MKKVILLCLSLFAAAGLQAQSSTMELDLETAIEIALSENPTIKVANMEIARYEYVKKEALGSLYPNISAAGQYSRVIKSTKLASIEMPIKNEISAGATLTLPLFAPTAWSNIKLTREQMLSAVEAARASRVTLVSDVKKAYYNNLLAVQSLAVLQASKATMQKIVNDTEIRLQNDLASEYDLVTAQVQLINLDPSIYQVENAIKNTEMLIKMYLGIPEEVDIVLKGSLDEFSDRMRGNQRALSTDLDGNTDIAAINMQENILRQQFKLLRTQRMPVLALFGSYQWSANDLDRGAFSFPGVGGIAASERKFDWQNPINVGLQMSVPIFAGFTNTNREKQLKNTMQQVSLQKDYLKEGMRVQLNSAIGDINTAYSKMRANGAGIEQAHKAYTISKVRYDEGMGTILELNSAELASTQARLNYVQSICDYLSAMAEYERIKGEEK